MTRRDDQAGLTMRELLDLARVLASGRVPGEPYALSPQEASEAMRLGSLMRPDEILDAATRRGVYTAYAKVATLDLDVVSRAGL